MFESGRSAAGAFVGMLPLGAGAVAAALVAIVLLRREEALDLPAYDNAFFGQVIWNVGHGSGFSSGLFPADFLGLHFSPLLALPALLELLWPDPRLLLVLHALAVGASAPAAFLFLRALLKDRPGGSWLAAVLAAPLPFWAELQQAAQAGFHTEMLALPLTLLAAWAGLSGRSLLCWILALAALSAREDQGFAVAVVGTLIFFHGPSRRLGAALTVAAVAWGVAVVLVVMPHLLGGTVSQVDNYYRWLRTAPAAEVAMALAAPTGWIAFAGMVVSLGGLPLLRPGWLALALPPLAGDLLSAHHPQPELLFQYGLPLVVPVLVAGGLGARRLLEGRPPSRVMVTLALPPLLVGLAFGPLPRDFLSPAPQAPAALEGLRACTSQIPQAAPVAADDATAFPLASRPQLRAGTEAAASDFVVVDRSGRLPTYVDRARRAAVLARLPAGGRRLLCDDGRFQLWSPAGA